MFKHTHKMGLIGLVITLVMGMIISLSTSNYIKDKIIHVTGMILAEFVEGTLLKDIDLREITRDNPSSAQLNRLQDNTEQLNNLELIKIWNPQGKIVHSTNSALVGKSFPLDHDLGKALAGQYIYELSTLDKEENLYERKQYQRLYELYIPIKNPQNKAEIIGVFEVYWNADHIYSILLSVIYTIFAVLSIGYVVVYVIMYMLLHRLIKIISKKDTEITQFINRLTIANTDRDKAYTGTIQSLLTALDAKDQYTAGHAIRVADYALKIGKGLNLAEPNLELLEKAALFHDIGKIAIPEPILNKLSALNDEEYEILKKHPVIGEQIIQASGILDETAHIIRHHHECFDGTGYPDAIRSEEIPLESQILAVADTFDALTSDRPYRKHLSTDQAITILQEASGKQLNPELVNQFITILKEESLN